MQIFRCENLSAHKNINVKVSPVLSLHLFFCGDYRIIFSFKFPHNQHIHHYY